MHKKHYLLILGILWQAFIFTQSLLPGEISSNQSGFIVDVLYPIINDLGIPISVDNFSLLIRKLAHFTEYFILGLLWFGIYLSYRKPNWLPWVVVIQGFIAACIDETIQRYTPNRSGEFRDVLIDTLGVLTAVIVILLLSKIKKARKKAKIDF